MAELTDILERLIERTSQNAVPWKPTGVEDSFVATIGNLSVLISKPGAWGFDLAILNKEGKVVDELHAVNAVDRHGPRLSELHLMARRIALATNSQLEELLQELEQLR